MSRRLQVLFDEGEYREIRRIARRHRLTVSAWVRQVVRELLRREPAREPDRKLQAVRAAARSEFPTADIEQMLAEIRLGG